MTFVVYRCLFNYDQLKLSTKISHLSLVKDLTRQNMKKEIACLQLYLNGSLLQDQQFYMKSFALFRFLFRFSFYVLWNSTTTPFISSFHFFALLDTPSIVFMFSFISCYTLICPQFLFVPFRWIQVSGNRCTNSAITITIQFAVNRNKTLAKPSFASVPAFAIFYILHECNHAPDLLSSIDGLYALSKSLNMNN